MSESKWSAAAQALLGLDGAPVTGQWELYYLTLKLRHTVEVDEMCGFQFNVIEVKTDNNGVPVRPMEFPVEPWLSTAERWDLVGSVFLGARALLIPERLSSWGLAGFGRLTHLRQSRIEKMSPKESRIHRHNGTSLLGLESYQTDRELEQEESSPRRRRSRRPSDEVGAAHQAALRPFNSTPSGTPPSLRATSTDSRISEVGYPCFACRATY